MSVDAPAVGAAPSPHVSERRAASGRAVERRIGVIWLLLLGNGLPWIGASILPVPQLVTKAVLFGALCLALVLAVRLNPRLRIRPNVVLGLCTVLAAVAFMTSIRGTAGLGAVVRCARLALFVSVLWLLTPWWGRREMVLVRCHLRAVTIVWACVVAGALASPSLALGDGRLTGVLWPVPPTQVGEFGAVGAGMFAVWWLAGGLARRRALPLIGVGLGLVLLSRTRTALLALGVGGLFACAMLLVSHRRARRLVAVALVAVPISLLLAAPQVSVWLSRGQTTTELAGLTGRRQVWDGLLAAPRAEFNRWFGFGLSDKSFGGRPIDDTWLSVYQDEGLVGDVLVAGMLLSLVVGLAACRHGPSRALATLLVVYCTVASYSEVGLGDATPYLLHIVVAASLVTGAGASEDVAAV